MAAGSKRLMHRDPVSMGVVGSAQLADLVLVGTSRGTARIILRTYDPPAARTDPPSRVKLVSFEIGVCVNQMLLSILDIASCLDGGQREDTRGRAVRTRRHLFVSHRRQLSVRRDTTGFARFRQRPGSRTVTRLSAEASR
jgi:hypothetical protein